MLDFCTAAPVPITIAGRPYRIGPLKLREEGELVAYLRTVVPRPTTVIREVLDLFPPEDRRRELIAAIQADKEWPPAPVSPEGQKILMGTPEGQRYFLGVVLRKYQPQLTDADIDAIMGEWDDEDFLVVYHIAFGGDSTDPESVRATVRSLLWAVRALPEETDAPQDADARPTGENSSTI